jgi:hypothetical protein
VQVAVFLENDSGARERAPGVGHACPTRDFRSGPTYWAATAPELADASALMTSSVVTMALA